jgi:hypothetical protein
MRTIHLVTPVAGAIDLGIRETELTIKSAIHGHETQLNPTINWKMLTNDSRPYRLHIKEPILMQQQQPELNKTVSSVPLIVFPDGLTGLKPKAKMKQQIRHHEGGGGEP